jgi:hypothetical protein
MKAGAISATIAISLAVVFMGQFLHIGTIYASRYDQFSKLTGIVYQVNSFGFRRVAID